MRNFKKIIVLVLAIVFIAGAMAACAKPDDGKKPEPPASTSPSIVGDATSNYFPDIPKDMFFNVNLANGTFTGLKNGSATLASGTDYTFNMGSEILTVKKAYVATLSAGSHKLTVMTSGGTCEVTIVVRESLTAGYNMQFAIPSTYLEPDHFFAKVKRDDTAVTFDFITFGDFTVEGTSLKFVNLYLDLPAYNNDARNWYFNAEDRNYRIYSDGTVVKKADFDGKTDNIWWKMDWVNKDYVTDQKVEISRVDGVTKFSFKVPYTDLGIAKDADFRFQLRECSDNSPVDFGMYEGALIVDGMTLKIPDRAYDWPVLKSDGSIAEPTGNQPPAVDAETYVSFASEGPKSDSFVMKAERSATGVTFNFKAGTDFDKDGDALEFVNIYLDIKEFNTGAGNWYLKQEDKNVRVYSDGTVIYRDNFNGNADNIWWKNSGSEKTLPKVTITVADGFKTFSLTLTNEWLGITKDDDFAFLMVEASDNSGNDFALYDSGKMAVHTGENVANVSEQHLPKSWPLLKANGKIAFR